MKADFEFIRNHPDIRIYVALADQSLQALGYTEHSFAHVTRCAMTAANLLERLGYDERQVELAKIAGFMHDIGNVINREDHSHTGAIMAFQLLDKLGMEPEDVADVISAIGNHDEGSAYPVNATAAALILADKTDVRRSRVRNCNTIYTDIHDRVNYAATNSALVLSTEEKTLTLTLDIDTDICSVADYFEIFLSRMLLCRKAAEFFHLQFKLIINDSVIM